MNEIWIEEPTIEDDTFAKSREHTLDWLARSTHPRAKQSRIFLNHNLSLLPPIFAEKLKHDLRSRWKTAFFELIVGRLLQEIGFDIEYEETLADGKNPDFLVKTSIGEIVVEATAPLINSEIGGFYKTIDPLIEFIKLNAPHNHMILIGSLPEFGFEESKKEFKHFIKKKFDRIPTEAPQEGIRIIKEFPQGKLDLRIVHKPDVSNPIGSYPPIAYMENSKERIKRSLDNKRSQLKKIKKPVILAIQGSETGTDREDFDQVLYGQTYQKLDWKRDIVEVGFDPNGIFVSDNKDPTYQAVLAFDEVGFRRISVPTIYLHQQANSKLKHIFSAFHVRYFDNSQNQIRTIESDRNEYLNNFKFVTV